MKRNSRDAAEEFLSFLSGKSPYPEENPAVIIASAHYDDETIGLGGQIYRIRNAVFVHTTDSSPANLKDAHMNGCTEAREFSKVRYNEFCSAMNAAGHRMPSAVEFGIPDQQSSYLLKGLTSEMFSLLANLSPEIIITHPFEGGHPDHDACAFAVHSAAEMLRNLRLPVPLILEFASYFASNEKMTSGDFLPYEGLPKYEVGLTGTSLDIKLKMLACYRTQQHVLRYFPAEKECFREAPAYDFTHPPHAGKLYYDNFDWGIDSRIWIEQAVKARKELRAAL